MGFGVNRYCTVWSVEPKGNATKIRLSSSRKNKETDQFEQDFSGFCVFIGEANKKAAKLKERDRIKILECEVTSRYDSNAKREYVDYKVFNFEMADGAPAKSAPQSVPAFVESNDVDGDDTPF
jgi:hypothetical protein